MAEQFDTSFHRLDELWAYTNMPILAGIPRIHTWSESWRHWLRFSLAGILSLTLIAFLAQAAYSIGQTGTQLVWMLAQRGM
jgi:intracellular septation protein A